MVYNHHILNIKGCDEDGRTVCFQRVGVRCEPIAMLFINLSLPSREPEHESKYALLVIAAYMHKV